MRKLKLLLTLCVLAVGGAISPAFADTTKPSFLDENWSLVTSLPTAEQAAANYYVFVCQDYPTLVMGISQTTQNNAYFITGAAPNDNPHEVWMLSYQAEGSYQLTNVAYDNSPMNSSGGDHIFAPFATARNYTLTEKETNVFYLKNGNSYVGTWNENSDRSQIFIDEARTAANKAIAYAAYFNIYACAKTNYTNNVKQTALNALTASGASYPVTATSLIANNDFAKNSNYGWVNTYSGGANAPGNGVSELFNNTSFDYHQTLTGLPNGCYTATVQAFYRDAQSTDNTTNDKVYFYAGNSRSVAIKGIGNRNSGTTKPTGTGTAYTAFNTNNDYLNTLTEIYVTDGTLTIGLKKESRTNSDDWCCFDNFTLTLTDPYVSAISTSFTSGSTMTAGQWYSFTVPANGDYTLSVTEGVVYTVGDALVSQAQAAPSAIVLKEGDVIYLKSTTAQTLTISKQTTVADGDYYLYDAATQQFLSRGSSFGTKALLDKYGLPFTWNNYNIIFKDANNGLYLNSAGILYTDGTAIALAFTATDEGTGYYLQDATHSQYLGLVDSDYKFISDKASAQVWTVKTKAERDAIVAGYTAQNYTNVSTAASLSGVTSENFLSYLSTNYAAKDKTSLVGTAKFSGSAGDWTYTSTRGDAATYGTNWTEAYSRTGAWTQTITGLDKGIYKVTVNGFERDGGYASCNTLGAAGYQIVTAYFKANDEQVQLKSWYSEREGTNNPNSTDAAATAFNNDKYKNEVYTVVTDGTLTLTVAKPSYVWDDWVLFNNVTLTYYDNSITDAEVTAILAEATTQIAKPMLASLKSAIETAKSTLENETTKTLASYNALRAAIDASVTSVDSYATMKANYLDPMADMYANTNLYDSSVKTAGYDTYLSQYNNGTISNADANAKKMDTGDRYNSEPQSALMSIWKIGETAATTSNSGFYQNTWSSEGNTDGSNFKTPFFEYWTGDGNVLGAQTLTATKTGLTANGIYEVTAWVRVRQTNNQTKAENGITMQVGSGTAVDVSAGEQIGTSALYIGSYTARGKADSEGTLTITFTVAAESNISWLSFRNVNYTAITGATDAEKSAFSSALATANAKVIGFEAEEYAPYENATVIAALADANLIDAEYAEQSVVTAATAAIAESNWHQNTAEVNGFYRGSFAEYTTSDISGSTGRAVAIGWSNSNASDCGVVGLQSTEPANGGSSNSGLGGLTSKKALFLRSGNVTYGSTAGYTLPLKANTAYRLTFKYAAWNGDTSARPNGTVTVKKGETTITNTLSSYKATGCGNSSTTAWTEFTADFITTDAGDYTITFSTDGAAAYADLNLERSDLELDEESTTAPALAAYRSAKLKRTLSADHWNTFCLPFDMTAEQIETVFGGDTKITEYDSENTENRTVTMKVATAIEAGVPYLIKPAATTTNPTISGVIVKEATGKTVGNQYRFIGVIQQTEIAAAPSDGTLNYFLNTSNQMVKPSSTGNLKGMRAYFNIPAAASGEANVRVLISGFDDESTGISTVQSDASPRIGTVYDLSGRRVQNPQHGIYVKNDKKVVIK